MSPKKRAWLRHPARTIVTDNRCLSGKPRFPTIIAAQNALTMQVTGLEPVRCFLCRGWHNEKVER